MFTHDSAWYSRRNFLQLSAGAAAGALTAACSASAAAVVAGESEPALGALRPRDDEGPHPADAVVIDQNENPLGPYVTARESVINIVAQGGRYSAWLTRDLVATFAAQEGLKPEYVRAFPGSSGPLTYSVLSFTSPSKSYVTADPGYEAGMHISKTTGARVVKVPLTKSYAHDVKAMLAAASDAGLFYICSPNNPTGTLTSHSEIEFLVANKPKESVVLMDEAYIHFSDATTALDLVKADKDIVVLRTFSKIYGMAGLRCGFAIARPDLLEKMSRYSGWTPLPITAMVAANASLKHDGLVAERKRVNASVRQETFDWLAGKGYAFVPSQSNCFMLDAKRPAKEMIAAMAAQNVFIGRAWPIWPTHVRITVGTQAEMERFRTAFDRAMTGKVRGNVALLSPAMQQMLDGVVAPSHC